MKIAAIEKTPVGLIFHKEPTKDGLYLFWDNDDKKFYTSVMQPGMPMRRVENEKYARAENETEAKRIAAEFFAALGEDD
jgi:hypothetical protein